MLRGDSGDLFVNLFGDLNKASTVNLAKPLQIPQLASQLKKSAHYLLDFILVKRGHDVWDAAIPILQEIHAPAGLGVLFVVERVDILQITIKGKEELCAAELGGGNVGLNPAMGGVTAREREKAAHLLDLHFLLPSAPFLMLP